MSGRVSWSWAVCTDYRCGHSRAITFVPWMIRWENDDNLGDLIRRNFVCSKCGKKGALLYHPGVAHETLLTSPFPQETIRIGGRRRDGESCLAADARNKAEYLARYPSGDALGEFRGGPISEVRVCGKFTAMASWAEVVDFSQPLTSDRFGGGDNDRSVTLRVMNELPVIVWDREAGKRKVVAMRWGFPHRMNPMRPDPIHARAETIDEKPTFKDAFLDGQRGVVIMRTFNEGLELPNGKTEQHTITPGDLQAVGVAFLWRRFQLAGSPGPLTACVMATVPANQLISTITDRMPAVLAEEDWAKWLGEEPAPPDQVKACLKTVEGVRWTMTKEERAAKTPRSKPTPSDPKGFL